MHPPIDAMSILIDTNVLSELLRAAPEPPVLAWFAVQRSDALFVSAVTQAEMLVGVLLLPPGRRRARLQQAVDAMFRDDFAAHVLAFDEAAATAYAGIAAARRRAGRPIAQFDAQIAAIASCRGMGLATRNVDDFAGCGLTLHNPWIDAT